MAIEKKLIHFGKLADFEAQLTAGNILDYSIVFIQDAKKIWTHGTYYDCSEGEATGDEFWYESDDKLCTGYDTVIDANLDVLGTLQASRISAFDGNEFTTGEQGQVLTADGNGNMHWGDLSIPTNVSELANDKGYLDKTTADESYTKSETFESSTYAKANGVADYHMSYALPTSANGDEDDVLLSRDSVKTINGESIYGGGDITIEGGSLTESDIAAMGFTKNTGTYSKPSGGIPKSDLASAVQTSLGKADTALQSYTEQYKGTITGVSANGTSVATSGVANIPAASTSAYGVTKLSSATNSTSTSLAATASAVKAAYDLANSYKGTVTEVKINGSTKSPSSGVVDLGTVITSHQDISGKQDKLVSGTNIKTVNGESILGSGDISISAGGGGTITGVSANGTSIATSGVANIPAATTSAYGVTKLSSATNSTSTTEAATPSAVRAVYGIAGGKQDKLVSGTNIKTINGTSILGSGDITISGGSSSEDIRYFTEFTVEDIIEASATNTTVSGKSKLKIAAANNKLICIPHENVDTGYLVASYSYKDYGDYSRIILRLEYNGNIYTIEDSEDDLLMVNLPVNPSGGIVERQINYTTSIEVQDNTLYSLFVEGEFHSLLVGIFDVLPKGSTIRFFSSHYTDDGEDIQPMILDVAGPEVLWANGVVPEIEIDTWYELSLTTSGDMSYCLAVLTPFKAVE